MTRGRAAQIGAIGVDKRYGRVAALEDVTLTVAPGEFVTLLGPSGSGKTTLLMILSGFEPPTRGRLTLDGRDVTTLPAEARGFGMVFQGYALFPHMSVTENIAFPLRVQGLGRAEIRARVAEMVDMVGLGDHGDKRPSALSGGQQQRVALARALIYRPPALLLDEPFSALDKNLRGAMQEEVRRLHRETGTTFVFVTHDQTEALALSDRIAIFDHGRLQQVGTPREVYERPANRFVAEFLGEINLLPLEEVGEGGARVEGEAIRVAQPSVPGATTLAVRPEYMSLHLERPTQANALAATLCELTYLGAETRLRLESRGGTGIDLIQPTARLPDGLDRGRRVWVGWPETSGFFL